MKYAHIIDDVIITTSSTEFGDCTTEVPDEVDVGWTFADDEWTPPALTAEEALWAKRLQMADILDALPLADRMSLQPLRVAIEHALNLGQLDLALYTVQHAVIPEHLESVRTDILALFPQS